MENTPRGSKPHIGLFGNTNSGKSSIFNAIIGQDLSITSPINGSTSDPVKKSMELLPFGPVLFIDTAGFSDNTNLADKRIDKTIEIIPTIDLALYIMDSSDLKFQNFHIFTSKIKEFNTNYILIFNKVDKISDIQLNYLKDKYPNAIFISSKDKNNIITLQEEIISLLDDKYKDPSILLNLVPSGGNILLVVPIDSETPKGRIILPQVQVIRDALDNNINSYIVRDTQLKSSLHNLNKIDLVITDSQIFKEVDKIVPSNIKLTSFSILFARQKGDISAFIKGVETIKSLNTGDNILMLESCTHNISHEDIGRYKIPTALNKFIGGSLNFDYKISYDFPKDNIDRYKLVIHCGGCMINRKTLINRIHICEKQNIPITNYGILLAFLSGILDRAIK